MTDVTAKKVRELLNYDCVTGMLTWRKTFGNQVQLQSQAGWIEPKGYRRLMIGGEKYLAHRIIWLHVTGRWPVDQIDHVNLSRSDNRWINLREATNSQNQANIRRRSTSGSKIKGVYWHKHRRMWQSSIMKEGYLKFLGYFDNKNDAAQAYALAAEKCFGQYARTK